MTEPDEDIDAIWADEIERRVRQIDAGEVKTIPWEEVQARIHARLTVRVTGPQERAAHAADGVERAAAGD